MQTERKPWLILVAGVIVAIAVIAGALIIARSGDPAPAASEPAAARTLPDGTTATAAQDAYLDAVEPNLTAEHAADILKVLQSGEDGVCGTWLHPADPVTQVTAKQMLMSASGYNQTEAAVIAQAAVEHLCPDQ